MPRELVEAVLADFKANPQRPDVRRALLLFRCGQYLRNRKSLLLRIVGKLVGRVYKGYTKVFLNLELPIQTVVGIGLYLPHPTGVIVNAHSRIGEGVTLRQAVTLGARRGNADAPTLLDFCVVHANAVVLGDITLGDGAVVGAGAIVLGDVPAGGVVVGAKAALVRPVRADS